MDKLVNDGISVIVPVYNVEKYLNRCVDSILNQSFQNFEVILVDDGSIDKSGEICDLYAAKDRRIKVIHKENGGLNAARKSGIDVSVGKYIMFIDSDDVYVEGVLEKAHQTIEAENVDIVQFHYYKTENIEDVTPFGTGEVKIFDGRDALLQIMTQKAPNAFNNLVWCKIYKSEIVKKPKYNLAIKKIEDAPTTARIFYYADKVATLDLPLYYYIQRKDENSQSIMYELAKSREKFILSHIRSFSDISNFFKDKDSMMYQASLKQLIAFALSAIKEKGLSKQGKKQAVWVLKQHKISGNPYIPFKKKVVAGLIKFFSVFVNIKNYENI